MSGTTSVERHRSSLHFSSRELVLIFVFWTFLATLSTVNRLVDPRGFGLSGFSTAGPIALAFLESWVWAALTPLIFWMSSRYTPQRGSWALRVTVLILFGLIVAAIVYTVLGFARMEILPPPPRRRGGATFSPLQEIARLRFLNQFVVYMAILAAGFAREYFLRDQKRQREAVLLQAQASQLQAQLSDARLDALRMQINPHFLFNTLHAISALVERDPGGVRTMIARLSELMRYTVESHGADEVTVREELDFLRRYLEIMEIRFQGKLRIETSIDTEALEALVPNLILQPIVENALEHGVSRSSGQGTVTIEARRSGDELVLTVRDNGPGASDSGRQGEGVGLGNTRARLAQLYGETAALSLTGAEGGGAVAKISLPYHTGDDLRIAAVNTSRQR